MGVLIQLLETINILYKEKCILVWFCHKGVTNMDMTEIEQTLTEQMTINRSLIALTAENDETISNLCQAVSNLTTICTAQQEAIEGYGKIVHKLASQSMMMGMNN